MWVLKNRNTIKHLLNTLTLWITFLFAKICWKLNPSTASWGLCPRRLAAYGRPDRAMRDLPPGIPHRLSIRTFLSRVGAFGALRGSRSALVRRLQHQKNQARPQSAQDTPAF